MLVSGPALRTNQPRDPRTDSSPPGVPKVELRAEDGVLCCASRDSGGGGRKVTQWEEQRGWGSEVGTGLPKPQGEGDTTEIGPQRLTVVIA